ncbi:MAG: hypothetical protein ACD_46C00314G0005 [uncultured bacterium]|nr:MAG: hypothetical protein ACD_46C00314G0005 [uncultured bacterium]
MSHLVTLENISLAYGLHALLDEVKLQINTGERICLIGRNGAGKSSLMKIIEGVILPDSGMVWRKPHLRISRLSQELPEKTNISIYEFVADGLAETGKLLTDYHTLTQKISHSHTQDDLRQLEKLQNKIDAVNGWQFNTNIESILTRLELNAEQSFADLSGGWQRRAALAKALVSSPELLLLDEPTNHLDISAIQWLEDQLLSLNIGILFITHDRSLLRRLATRIIELDRGQLTSWPGDYDNFLIRKEEMLHAEAKHHADFDKKLAEEERWIRQGVKARRTRNEGRVRALEEMRRERSKRREVQGKATFNINEADKSGQLVVEAKNVSHSFDDRLVIKNFSTRIIRGDKIGLIGPNGIGKSTLLNILLGNLQPQHGTVTIGTKLKIAYFDQMRQALAPEKTVMENVAEGRESIEVNGKTKHIISYLGDFLFTPQRAMTPVKALSGGECNRLLLARLFSQPANLLVLDEPTNDLDIETLELLEELLMQYQDTLLLVSHDREFLDNVVTSTIAFEGNGVANEYVGGYHDWLKQREKISTVKENKTVTIIKQEPAQSKKLSYHEQRELTELPKKIELLEAQQKEWHARMATNEFYQKNANEIAAATAKIKQIETELAKAYARWEELEGKQSK